MEISLENSFPSTLVISADTLQKSVAVELDTSIIERVCGSAHLPGLNGAFNSAHAGCV